MRITPLIFLLPLLVAACASLPSQERSLELLRQTVQARLPYTWACGPVTQFDGRRFFVATGGRYEIQITATEPLTQAEWDVRYARSMAAMDKLVSSTVASRGDAIQVTDDLVAGLR